MQQIETLLSEIGAQTNLASEHVADQVEALRSVSAGAIQQASELAYSLEERGRALTESTRDQLRSLTEATMALERVEGRMATALDVPPGRPQRSPRPHQRALARISRR